MKDIISGHFYGRLHNKKEHYPWNGQIELTYRCNLNCIHCYCKGLEDKNTELNTFDWKKILDEIQKQGCVYLTFTGGEPLVRDDFLELYSYAKRKGFIISIFTNGQALRQEVLDYFAKSPPFSIEITLNGITKPTYESITQVEGSFERVMGTIRELKKRGLPLILKTNLLKQNRNEIGRIKAFADEFLGKGKGKYYFKYDPMIYPRLNGDKTPCQHRLSFKELLEVKRQDPDIWQEYQKGLHSDFSDFKRDRSFLYHCNAWMSQFFINPQGRLKFCQFTEKFSVDLKTTSFKEGFYKVFPQVLREQYRTNSKCRDCTLRLLCYHCPARAYLETGDEEAPVEYYCELAKALEKQMKAPKLAPDKTVRQNEIPILL